ncbi:uncharacterized protein LOC141850686 [Brevipalpus obovatus]|uniref:uncharacterized protein LOC141850686 n=1 Tax=Brevipalpus obovatus TaxID=246614 RepID=UPI003D9DC249
MSLVSKNVVSCLRIEEIASSKWRDVKLHQQRKRLSSICILVTLTQLILIGMFPIIFCIPMESDMLLPRAAVDAKDDLTKIDMMEMITMNPFVSIHSGEVETMESPEPEDPSHDANYEPKNSVDVYLGELKRRILSSFGPLLENISEKAGEVVPMDDEYDQRTMDQKMMQILEQKQEILELIESVRKDLQDENLRISLDLQEVKKSVKSLQSSDPNIPTMDSIEHMIHKMIPISFIYTQLPFQKPPQVIWPWATWQEITSNYSGYFFRAEGGNSRPFEKAQDDAIIYHKHADSFGLRFMNIDSDLHFVVETNVSQPLGDPLNRFFIKRNVETMLLSFDDENKEYSLRETRPQNYAIKIWIRKS